MTPGDNAVIVWVWTLTLTLVAGTICWVDALLSCASGLVSTKFTVMPLVNPLPVMVIGWPPSIVPVPLTLVTVVTVGPWASNSSC